MQDIKLKKLNITKIMPNNIEELDFKNFIIQNLDQLTDEAKH